MVVLMVVLRVALFVSLVFGVVAERASGGVARARGAGVVGVAGGARARQGIHLHHHTHAP